MSRAEHKNPELILRPSNIRAAIDNGTISHNLTLTFPEPTIAEWAGYAGFDAHHLDMEHGVLDRKSVVQGKSVDLGGRRIIKIKNITYCSTHSNYQQPAMTSRTTTK